MIMRFFSDQQKKIVCLFFSYVHVKLINFNKNTYFQSLTPVTLVIWTTIIFNTSVCFNV